MHMSAGAANNIARTMALANCSAFLLGLPEMGASVGAASVRGASRCSMGGSAGGTARVATTFTLSAEAYNPNTTNGYGLALGGAEKVDASRKQRPQGLKPGDYVTFTARINPCP